MIELTKQTTIGEVPIVVRKEGESSEGKWFAKTYEDFKKIGPPSKKWIENVALVSTKEYLDVQLNNTMKRGDRKVTHIYTYIFVDEDYECENAVKVDDEGCLYLNDEYAVEKINGHNTFTPVILSFKKGWNKIEGIFYNGTGGDGLWFEKRLSFDENIKKIQYEINNMEEYSPTINFTQEESIKRVSIKPVIQKSNYVNADLLSSDMFYDHAEMENYLTPEKVQSKYGGWRFRFDHTHEHQTTNNWRWYWTKLSEPKSRAFLLKPNTTYTVTYFVHEYINETTDSNPRPYIWVGDTYYSYSIEPGMHTLTFTSDRSVHFNNFSPIRVCYHSYMDYVMPEGTRRVIDIELISMVEGNEPVVKHTPFFSSVGNEKGISVYTQDYEVKLGEYSLEGDIPNIIQDIDNRIENKNNEFDITWI